MYTKNKTTRTFLQRTHSKKYNHEKGLLEDTKEDYETLNESYGLRRSYIFQQDNLSAHTRHLVQN